MSTWGVLVVGDWREQLEPRLRVDLIDNPFSPHITCAETPFRSLSGEFRRSQKNLRQKDRVSFARWAEQRFGLNALVAGEHPDLAGAHREGWLQPNERTGLVNVVKRNVGAHAIFWGSPKLFLLKQGTTGWEVQPREPEDQEVCAEYVASARLRDIDFQAMRQPIVAAAPSNWERALRIAAGRTWVPFTVIRQRLVEREPIQAGLDASFSEYESAFREWLAQPVVRQLREEGDLVHLGTSLLDPVMLPRDDYLEYCVRYAPVLKRFEVLHQHRRLIAPDEADLLSELDGDTRLTDVTLKS